MIYFKSMTEEENQVWMIVYAHRQAERGSMTCLSMSAADLSVYEMRKRRELEGLAAASRHACGLQGYNPMIDPLCPGCAEGNKDA